MKLINLIAVMAILAGVVLMLFISTKPPLPNCWADEVLDDNWQTINIEDGVWVIDGVACKP